MTRRLRHLMAVMVAALALGMIQANSALADTQPAPDALTGALTDNVANFALELGRPVGLEAAQTLTALPVSMADPMASIVGALLECHKTSSQLDLARLLGSTDPVGYSEAWKIRDCASGLATQTAELQKQLREMGAEELRSLPRIDAWPVLRFEPSSNDDVYLHDYALLIDLGGNDSYFNNAGGNLIDLVRGPEDSPAPEKAPAAGCQNIPALARGGCVVSAAALLDMGGDDVYGRLETPDEDANFVSLDGLSSSCTQDLLVRRIVTQGSGLAGVGLLVDESGDDTYLGKTLSQGAGHAWGAGFLKDYGKGNDSYLAIRSSQGFGLVGQSVGSLWDEGGDDTYDYYMPAGSESLPGGVISDKGVCDAVPRNLQGAGMLGAKGMLEDLGGTDTYRAPGASQGFGSLGGYGTFWDCSGLDNYVGPVGRSNGITVMPSDQSTGMFIDEGPAEAEDQTEQPEEVPPGPEDGDDDASEGPKGKSTKSQDDLDTDTPGPQSSKGDKNEGQAPDQGAGDTGDPMAATLARERSNAGRKESKDEEESD